MFVELDNNQHKNLDDEEEIDRMKEIAKNVNRCVFIRFNMDSYVDESGLGFSNCSDVEYKIPTLKIELDAWLDCGKVKEDVCVKHVPVLEYIPVIYLFYDGTLRKQITIDK